jgi:CO dehydrogenase maturation factor
MRRYSAVAGGVRHLATGEFDEADVGVSCYHSTTSSTALASTWWWT